MYNFTNKIAEEIHNNPDKVSQEALKMKESWSRKEVIELLNSLRKYDGGEMQSVAEQLHCQVFNKEIDSLIKKL